jgi:poly(ADP-ribose) glycohydrolase
MFLDLLPAPPTDQLFNTISMNPMLNLAPSDSLATKIHCLVHYFERLAAAEFQPSADGVWTYPAGAVVYRRVCVASPPAYGASAALLVPLYAHVDGGIEDQGGALMVDFANKFIGGGVLRGGAVQEEIAFVQHPELLVSCALMPLMCDNEAVVMTGAEQFSQTTGYGRTLAWSAPAEDRTPRWRDVVALPVATTTHCGSSGEAFSVNQHEIEPPCDLLLRCVVAIDAQPYMLLASCGTPSMLSQDEEMLRMQLRREEMGRELTKALAGFSVDYPECSVALFPAVSTGRWGCGVFGGDDQLKSLLQWIAASLSHRELHMYTFGGAELAADLAWAMDTVRVKGGVTAGQLYTALLSFASEYKDGRAPAATDCGAGAAGARRVPIIRSVISRL